jgi:hypothetical protein
VGEPAARPGSSSTGEMALSPPCRSRRLVDEQSSTQRAWGLTLLVTRNRQDVA